MKLHGLVLLVSLGTCLRPTVASGAPPAAADDSAGTALVSLRVAENQRVEVTRDDLERAVAARLGHADSRQQLIEELVRYELLVAEADRRGYATHPVVERATKQAAIDRLQQAYAPSPDGITDSELDARLQVHRGLHERPALRRARHVQFSTRAEARALIASLADRTAEATIATLAQQARQHSTDARTRKQSGELGHFDARGQRPDGRQAVEPALARAAFALSDRGELAGPVQTQDGFSVLVLVDQTPARTVGRSEVEAQLRAELVEQKQRRAIDAFVQARRADVELHPQRLQAITLDDSAPMPIPRGLAAAAADPRIAPKQVEPDGY